MWSVTDASIWVMFISKNSDKLEIAKQTLFNYPIISFAAVDIISRQLITLIITLQRILGQFVNISGKRLFCDRALSRVVHVLKPCEFAPS